MTTIVINLKGRIHEYGPRLEHAPNNLVYVGRRMAPRRAGNWDLSAHPLANPYTLKDHGTPEAAVAAYIRHALDKPDLLTQARALRGKALACWCTPAICHAHAIAMYADDPSRERLSSYAETLEWAAGRVEETLFARLA